MFTLPVAIGILIAYAQGVKIICVVKKKYRILSVLFVGSYSIVVNWQF
jgi:hypothetical protein